MTKQRVLFICTHNSARSQMAEALLRHRYGERYEAQSAGTEPSRVHELAIEAMSELGIDVSGQQAKLVDDLAGEAFDFVVTVCDDAKEACPTFPNAGRALHWSLPDPSRAAGSHDERLAAFRSVRDEIARLLDETFAS
ncbi:MAG: arsenate reductase ArsC [Dehalococcoidia bacterium]